MPRGKAKAGFGKRKFEDQANGHTGIDWRFELVRFLIAGGTSGKTQSEIQRRLIAHAQSDEINNELEALLVVDKVQKFPYSPNRRGKPSTIWRATTKILED